MTTTIEDFRRTPVGERCFFADGGLGIETYDYDHGMHGTDRVREPEEATHARIRFVPMLEQAAERYRLALTEARRLESAAEDMWTVAWRQRCDATATTLDARDEAGRMANVVADVDWMELQEGTKAWRKWNRTGELAEGRGLRAWRARRRWQRIYDDEPRPDSVAEAAVYDARQQAIAAAERECERRMAAINSEWARAQQEVDEAKARAVAIIAHAERELARAYERAIEVAPAVACA